MIKPSPLRAAFGAALALLVCGSTHAVNAGPSELVTQAQEAMAKSDYGTAADRYAEAAATAQPDFAADFLLLAAEAALLGNNPAHADQLLSKIPSSGLDAHQIARIQLLRARVDVARGNYAGAAQILPTDPQDPVLADSMLLLRARALSQTGDVIGATSALVKREAFLNGSSLQNNRDAIWATLSNAPTTSLTPEASAGVDDLTRGWIDLARLARSGAPASAYEDWARHYGNHPGTERAQKLAALAPATTAAATTPPAPPQAAPVTAPAVSANPMPTAATVAQAPSAVAPSVATAEQAPATVATNPSAPGANSPPANPSAVLNQVLVPPWVAAWGPVQMAETTAPMPVVAGGGPVALLIPQSGPLAPAGNAIHDAFGNDPPTTQYNVSGTPQDAIDAFHKALSDGAGMVVGPLRKEDATAIATSVGGGAALPVPVIALNYLDGNLPVPPGLVQFGLAPEDEAQSAAADAYARGLRRAVILSAQGDWGDRIAAAYRRRFEALGGKIVDEGRYTTGTPDFSAPIKSLLKLDAADARYHSLQSALHVRMEYEPRRRSDVDVIFIGARATQARLITPQLRYFRAERLPIYATSSAYDGTIDSDLQGLRFCDVPALISSTLPSGQSVDLVRLTALGRDAAQLAKALRIGPLTGAMSFSGAAGLINVEPNGVVFRQLACAEFDAGGVRPLGAPDVAAAP